MEECSFLRKAKQEIIVNQYLSKEVKSFLLDIVEQKQKERRVNRNQNSALNSRLPGC